jgi:hypothetical protein
LTNQKTIITKILLIFLNKVFLVMNKLLLSALTSVTLLSSSAYAMQNIPLEETGNCCIRVNLPQQARGKSLEIRVLPFFIQTLAPFKDTAGKFAKLPVTCQTPISIESIESKEERSAVLACFHVKGQTRATLNFLCEEKKPKIEMIAVPDPTLPLNTFALSIGGMSEEYKTYLSGKQLIVNYSGTLGCRISASSLSLPQNQTLTYLGHILKARQDSETFPILRTLLQVPLHMYDSEVKNLYAPYFDAPLLPKRFYSVDLVNPANTKEGSLQIKELTWGEIRPMIDSNNSFFHMLMLNARLQEGEQI